VSTIKVVPASAISLLMLLGTAICSKLSSGFISLTIAQHMLEHYTARHIAMSRKIKLFPSASALLGKHE